MPISPIRTPSTSGSVSESPGRRQGSGRRDVHAMDASVPDDSGVGQHLAYRRRRLDHGRQHGPRLTPRGSLDEGVAPGLVQRGEAAGALGDRAAPGVPSSTTRPSASTSTRSAISTVDSRWAMISAVRERARCAARAARPARSGRPARRSPRPGSAPPGRRGTRARTRPAGAARPRAGHRACGRRCRTPRAARVMNSCAPTACAAATISLPGRAEPAEADVVGDRAREQEAVLRDHDDRAGAARDSATVAQVDAVQAHRAGGRVVEARDQLRDRRLARAGRADERDGLAGRDVERRASAAPAGRRRSRTRPRPAPAARATGAGSVDRRRPAPARTAARRARARSSPARRWPTAASCRTSPRPPSGRRTAAGTAGTRSARRAPCRRRRPGSRR